MKPAPVILSMLFLGCAVLAQGKEPTSQTQETEFRDPFSGDNGSQNPEISDPLERVNRTFFHFNNKLYRWVLEHLPKEISETKS